MEMLPAVDSLIFQESLCQVGRAWLNPYSEVNSNKPSQEKSKASKESFTFPLT